MQKVVQRSQQAIRQAARRREKKQKEFDAAEAWTRRRERQQYRQHVSAGIVEARQRRQEDWERGPLAPRRDVGDKAETYGARPAWSSQMPKLETKNLPKWWHIVEGDRVVVVRGRDKGKIGKVQDVKRDAGAVQIEGVNVEDMEIPNWLRKQNKLEQKLAPLPIAVPVEDVRLVYPLPDPKTGVPRDVVVNELVPINREWDWVKKEYTDGDRVISGTKTIVPWPPKLETQYEDYEDDTLRIVVDEETFRPHLLHPPMPLSAIDELRNKYSKFRTRHDYDFIQKMEAIDARSEKRKELIKTARTPLQELAARRSEEKARAEERELTDEQLEKIGEVIAREKEKAVGSVQSAVAAQ